MLKKLVSIFLVVMVLGTLAGTAFAQDEELRDQVIAVAAASEEFVEALANYETYDTWAEPLEEDPNTWFVEFYVESEDIFIGEALVDTTTWEIVESFVVEVLSEAELQAGEALVLNAIMSDSEVMAVVKDPSEWQIFVQYEGFDNMWSVVFINGLNEWEALVGVFEGEAYIESFTQLEAMDAYEEMEDERGRAVMLAFEAEGVDAALEGIDNWGTFAQPQADGTWSVLFVTFDRALFFVMVDLANETILEARPVQ